MILSLLPEFSERGLRLLEVKKDGLEDLTEILQSVNQELYKFIVSMICLDIVQLPQSSEESLEGSTVEQEQNIMFCAI